MYSTELATIIWCPASTSGIVVLLKTSPHYRRQKIEKPPEVVHMLSIFIKHGIITTEVRVLKTLENP